MERFWHTDMTVHRLLEGQAERIAFALHDDAAQLLASVHFALAAIANRLPAEHARQIQAARAMLDDAEAGLRHLAHELRPPLLEDLGLVPALEFLADGIAKRKGLCVAVKASVHRDVPAAVETTLYRIVQEALTNVAKHAQRDAGVGVRARACAKRSRAPSAMTASDSMHVPSAPESVSAVSACSRSRSVSPRWAAFFICAATRHAAHSSR